MKKLIVLVCGMTLASVVSAMKDSENRAVFTYGCPLSSASLNGYAAYYCSIDTAQACFGNQSTISGITQYLSENFATSMAGFAKSKGVGSLGYAMTIESCDNLILMTDSYSQLPAGDYLSLVTYEGDPAGSYFRVFTSSLSDDYCEDLVFLGAGEASTWDECAYFQEACNAQGGDWTFVAAPEPTSGLLILVGMAGLALRRKRCAAA